MRSNSQLTPHRSNYRPICLAVLAALAADIGHANDNASNYDHAAGNWVSGTHRGDIYSAFWTLESNPASGHAGHFIGNSTSGSGDINVDGKSFGMYANPPGNPDPWAGAVKRFAKPVWTTGDEVSFQIAVNHRNGNKGFNLRSTSGNNVWLFSVREDAYFVNADQTIITGYHAETIFTFTFVQRERHLDWTIVRSGGLAQEAHGSSPIPSGTIADIRFFTVGTSGGSANNLYFNNFTFIPAVRGDAPLTIGERRYPGFETSYMLRFSDPLANQVSFVHSGNWPEVFPMMENDGTWELDIRDVDPAPGWYSFKFVLDGDLEPGSNRRMFVDGAGRIAKPPAVYLTWTNDPATTMVVHWHTYDPDHTELRYRLRGSSDAWQTVTAFDTRMFGLTERLVQLAGITGLMPFTEYEFTVDGYEETYAFRTMPSHLDQPLRTMFTGDILFGSVANAMAVTAGALDPSFLMIGGDLSYSDSRVDQISLEYEYFENFHTRFRSPDGRLIPIVVAIGNHEMRRAYVSGYPYIQDTDAWRDREAIYFFRPYAFPGQPGYNVLDFGDYLSLLALDTDHANPIEGAQTDWLADRLDERRQVRHLLPVYHVPAYPSHRSLDDARNTKIRELWVPLFESAGVHMAFEHHDHTFKRTAPLLNGQIDADGIVFLGDGAWGVATRLPRHAETDPHLQVAQEVHHVFLVTLTDTGRLVQAVDVHGVIFDEMYQAGGDGIPPAPDHVQVDRATSVSVDLSWSAAPRATAYVVERDGAAVGTTDTTRWRDADRPPETSAQYTVRALNRSGESAPSSPVLAVTTAPPAIPAPPIAVAANAIGSTAVQVQWPAPSVAYTYTVVRDGVDIATEVEALTFTDHGLEADTSYTYHVRAVNVSGASSLSPAASVTTGALVSPFTLDGAPDSPGYLLASPGMRIYAALRGTDLYVATWTPAGGDSDHFIFVTDELLPAATRRMVWNKKGFIALPEGKPYLGAESTSSDFVGWFDAPGTAQAFRSPVAGEKIEGVIDVVEAFGRWPESIYLSAAAYGTASFNSLRAQVPLGNGDEHIHPHEFLALPMDAIRDSLGIGVFDRLDPGRSFGLSAAELPEGEGFTIRWRAVPGRQYHVWRATDLQADMPWTRLTAGPLTAASGVDEMVYKDDDSDDVPTAFYYVEVLDAVAP